MNGRIGFNALAECPMRKICGIINMSVMISIVLVACQLTNLSETSSIPNSTSTVCPTNVTPTLVAASTPETTPDIERNPSLTPRPTLAPYSHIPEQVADGWEAGSLASAGIDPQNISLMLDAIYRGKERGDSLTRINGGEKMQNIHGILIARHGKLVFEEYFYHYSRDNRHNLASVTKSVTSLLVGLALQESFLKSVDETVLSYFPDYLPLDNPDARKESITIQDLLSMRHGLDCDDWVPGSLTYWKNDRSYDLPDLVDFTLDLPVVYDPGSHYSYCSDSTILLGALLRRATGMSIHQFSSQYLFAPLGITRFGWLSTPGGWTDTGGSLQMRMRDMLKVGQLMLQGGQWNGQQLIPRDWIEQSVKKHVILDFNETWGNGYGYLWWLSAVQVGTRRYHSFSASGAGGQVITVFPDLDMVVVITGWNIDPDNGEPFQIMERYILPAVE
jgi:CubicO group peptidase (beta-lactamase class C family)